MQLAIPTNEWDCFPTKLSGSQRRQQTKALIILSWQNPILPWVVISLVKLDGIFSDKILYYILFLKIYAWDKLMLMQLFSLWVISYADKEILSL